MGVLKGVKRFRVFILILILSLVDLHSSAAKKLEKLNSDNESLEEPPTESLKPELRETSLITSDVIQLMEEEELRTEDNSSVLSKTPIAEPRPSKMDCSKITIQIFEVLLQNPDNVEPEDYSCGILNLISHVEKSHSRIRSLETSLQTASTSIKTLETSLQTEMAKTIHMIKELNETTSKETERAIKAENVIARRVLSERSRVDTIHKNLTDVVDISLERVKELSHVLKDLELQTERGSEKILQAPTTTSPQIIANVEHMHKMEFKLTSLQTLMHDLSNRILQMESGTEENVNKGISQIFKTYASLVNEIGKETERATGEEATLKTFITNEVSSLSKQIQGLQERIADEKNRAQVIESRRTADLFEEINRAKNEETRLGQKLKEEMSKAAAAFKKLEQHVDTQVNSTKMFEDELRSKTEIESKRAILAEEKHSEQLNYERVRALSVENSLKAHFEAEVTRAMTVENDLRKMAIDERDRAKFVEQELKIAIDVETYRAQGVELSISAQITSESERAKQEEMKLSEYINSNMTRLLTDIIKEFTRAQNAEKELDDKISNESSRAQTTETALLNNINTELTRASEKEQELHYQAKQNELSLRSLGEIRNLIEKEEARAKSAEQSLDNQIQIEVYRAKGNEDRIVNLMQEEATRAKSIESNYTHTNSEILRHTKELELEVRKTVMAEVARAVDAENNIKQQLNEERERATRAETTLGNYQTSNYSDMSSRLQQLTHEIAKDNMRLEDVSLQLARNLTGDLLTLAELFDDKMDDLERNENVRLKKLEDDMRKCCSGSSWRWRSPSAKSSTESTTSSVINSIMQAFSSVVDNNGEGVDKQPEKSVLNHAPFNTSQGSSDKQEIKGNLNVELPIKTSSTNQTSSISSVRNSPFKDSSNSTILPTDPSSHRSITISSDPKNSLADLPKETENQGVKMPSNNLRKKPKKNGRRTSGTVATSKVSPLVSVQSANSKVTSTFG